jgi:hypothetical protein
MYMLNADIPSFTGYIRRSFYTHKEADRDTFDPVEVFGIQSIPGKILTFHVMTDFGMLRGRVPLHEIYWKQPDKDIEPHYKQLWDCFGEKVSVHTFSYLKEKRSQIILKDRTKVWGTYQFTVDWYGNPYSDDPKFYKCAHIFFADDGYLLAQPNNRCIFKDMNWVTRPFPIPFSEIKTDRAIISVESFSDRWVSEDSDCFYYNIKTQA